MNPDLEQGTPVRIAFMGSADPFLSTFPPGGGIELQIWGLGKELAKRGHEIHILERFRGERLREVDGLTLHGVPAPSLADPFLSFLLVSRAAVPKLEEVHPDVLYLAERFTAFFPSRLQVPKVFATHNRDAFDFYRAYAIRRSPLNLGFFPLKQWMERRVMASCDLICPLTHSLDALVRAMGFLNTRVIPNAVDTDRYENAGDDDYILYSGQLRRFKAIDLLLNAFNELPRDFDHYRLLIGGTGPDSVRLQSLASKMRKRDRIRFLGWVSREHYLRLLARCTAFVLPSLFETFGIVLLEAMASGKPVVASRIIGPADVVIEGETGLLFPPGETGKLRSTIERLLADPRERSRMGTRGRRTAKEHYDFRVTAALLEGVFEEVVAS